MSKSKNLTAELHLRCDNTEKENFVDFCRRNLNRPYQVVIREMMTAMVEGRLTMTLNEEQKKAIKETYNVD